MRRIQRVAGRSTGFAASCTGLGLLTALLVAWALAAWVPHDGLTRRFNLKFGPRGSDYCVRVYEYRRAGMVRRWWRIERGRIAGYPLAAAQHENGVAHIESGPIEAGGWGGLDAAIRDQEGATNEALETAYGWPLPALWWRAEGGVLTRGFERVHSGIPIFGPWADSLALRSLPLMPVMSGFAGDSAIYGCGWAAVLIGAWGLRRVIRRRGGRCPACGYDLRRDLPSGCPECGWSRPAAAPV